MINVDRNLIAEPAITNSYRTSDILDALSIVFYDKCYICEKKMINASLFDVDHFVTQTDDATKKYVWDNLYLCCKECNISRSKKSPVGGFLDPCDREDNVEEEIVYKLPAYGYNEPEFLFRNMNPTVKVVNTVNQLKRLHYGNAITRNKCAALREIISREARKLITLIVEEKDAQINNDNVTHQLKSNQINRMLENTAPFTMLMRSVAIKYR